MRRLSCLALLVLALAVPAPARAADEGVKSLSVTVYNQGRALIGEVRSMELPKGTGLVEFPGVPETIEAHTLRIASRTAPADFTVLDMNYQYDLVSVKNLLDRYVGRELTLVLPDFKDAKAREIRKAKLLANNDLPVFQLDDGIYVGPYQALLLPEVPKGLRPKPTLVWLVRNDGPARQDVEVSYLAGQITWRADYVLTLNRANDQAQLAGWVTLANQSGMAFDKARLKLVAGDVRQAGLTERRFLKSRADVAMLGAAPQMQEEAFFEYHLYSLERPVSIANRETKQISLLAAPKLGVKKELVARFSDHHMGGGPDPIRQKVQVFLKFKNVKQNGLGLALPKGVVRAYQESGDGSSLLIGEDSIEHTAKGEEVRLTMGEAFDVKIERRLAKAEKIGKTRFVLAWEIRVRNGKDKAQDLLLQEHFPGAWKIVTASHEYKRLDARTAQFALSVPPTGKGEEFLVTYEVEIEE
jgi:hypothetical protein